MRIEIEEVDVDFIFKGLFFFFEVVVDEGVDDGVGDGGEGGVE